MEPPFEKLLVQLAAAEVRFIVVGGIAVVLNGYIRLTEDVHLLVDPDRGNIDRLLNCLAEFGEGYARELEPDDFSCEEGAIRIVEDSENCVIDLFTVMSGLQYSDLIGNAGTTEIGGRVIRHASKADLIRLKSGSAREKDQLDVSALRMLEQDPRAFD